jgi:hypothetical protein
VSVKAEPLWDWREGGKDWVREGQGASRRRGHTRSWPGGKRIVKERERS